MDVYKPNTGSLSGTSLRLTKLHKSLQGVERGPWPWQN